MDKLCLLLGSLKGFGDIAQPFVSESIWTEALGDLVGRGGRTRDGRLLKKPVEWKFQIVNLTNNFNVLFYNWNHYASPSKVSAVSMFPLILTFGVNFEL